MAHVSRNLDPAPTAASSPAQTAMPPALARTALFVAVALAVGLAHGLGQGEAATRAAAADPELTRLLRGMAVLKAGLALAVAALVAWRLTYPASRRLAAGLITAASLMAAGPVLIWHMAPVLAAALLFHAGTALLLALCWVDRSGARELMGRIGTRRRAAGG